MLLGGSGECHLCNELSGHPGSADDLRDRASHYMNSMTGRLKQALWRHFGHPDHPAEWDGVVYGGGKVSQRFWEYFKAIELLEVTDDAVLLDIGGGSPATGLSFFPRLLASCGIRVIVLDTNFGAAPDVPDNVELIHGLADRETLAKALATHRPTHLSCISVVEHASPEQQRGIFDAVEDAFDGSHLVLTLEFHETIRFFEQQLTTESLSSAVSGLTRYYLSDIERAPINCVNAFRDLHRLWYPLALRFVRRKMLPDPLGDSGADPRATAAQGSGAEAELPGAPSRAYAAPAQESLGGPKPPDAAGQNHYFLVSHHNTLLYADREQRRLRHAGLGSAPWNLVIERFGADVRLLMLGDENDDLRPISLVHPTGEFRTGVMDYLVETLEDGRVSLKVGRNYLSADLDGLVRNDRAWCREWEQYRIYHREVNFLTKTDNYRFVRVK
jgi:hypothetical protein